jgi:hypothetical protein
MIDRVIRLYGFGVSFPPEQVWLADQRPDDMKDFGAAGTWRWIATSTDRQIGPTANNRWVADLEFISCHPASLTDTNGLLATVTNLWTTIGGEQVLARHLLVNDGTDDIPYLLEDFSQGIPIAMDFPLLDFSDASISNRIRAVIGANDPRGPDHHYTNEKSSVITVSRFLHVHNVEFNSAHSNFVFFEDQFKDAIRDIRYIGQQPDVDARDDVRRDIFRMLDTMDVTFRIHYRDAPEHSRVIDWPTFQANRHWWDSQITGLVNNQNPFNRNVIWHSSGRLIEDLFDESRHQLLDLQGGNTWGPMLRYVGTSYARAEATQYVLFSPVRPVFVFDSFPDNAVTNRFGPNQSNPNYMQRTRQELINSAATLTQVLGLEAAPLATRSDLRPLSIREISGLLDDLNTHYRLTGNYTFNGETRQREMRFVSRMFDHITPTGRPELFEAWPTGNWATNIETPALMNGPLTIRWRGETLEDALRVNVIPHTYQLLPTPIRHINIVIPNFTFESALPSTGDFIASNTNRPASFIGGLGPISPATITDSRPAFTGLGNSSAVTWDTELVGAIQGLTNTLTLRLMASDTNYIFSPDITETFGGVPGVRVMGGFTNPATCTEYVFGTPVVTGPGLGHLPAERRAGGEFIFRVPVTARSVIDTVDIEGLPEQVHATSTNIAELNASITSAGFPLVTLQMPTPSAPVAATLTDRNVGVGGFTWNRMAPTVANALPETYYVSPGSVYTVSFAITLDTLDSTGTSVQQAINSHVFRNDGIFRTLGTATDGSGSAKSSALGVQVTARDPTGTPAIRRTAVVSMTVRFGELP